MNPRRVHKGVDMWGGDKDDHEGMCFAPQGSSATTSSRVLSVTQLNRQIRLLLEEPKQPLNLLLEIY